MSADVLRRAATLMRERAEAATPGPWQTHGQWVRQKMTWDQPSEFVVSGCADAGIQRQRADAAHIASWHPAVALAVADWLDDVATFGTPTDGHLRPCLVPALAVARAYLGEPS